MPPNSNGRYLRGAISCIDSWVLLGATIPDREEDMTDGTGPMERDSFKKREWKVVLVLLIGLVCWLVFYQREVSWSLTSMALAIMSASLMICLRTTSVVSGESKFMTKSCRRSSDSVAR